MKKHTKEILSGFLIVVISMIIFYKFVFEYMIVEMVSDDGSKITLSKGWDMVHRLTLLFLFILTIIGIIILLRGVYRFFRTK